MDKAASLQIVANSFLKYPSILAAQFQQFDVVDKNNKFAVYKAQF